MKENDLKERTSQFAHRCVKLSLALPETDLGNHIRKQFIRCSTSVASNYRAACIAQSKADFASKLSIVIEEADESLFWLEFIKDEKLLVSKELTALLVEANELVSIVIASRKTAQKRKN